MKNMRMNAAILAALAIPAAGGRPAGAGAFEQLKSWAGRDLPAVAAPASGPAARPAAAVHDDHSLYADCYGDDGATWAVALNGDGEHWQARVTRWDGPLSVADPAQGLTAAQTTDRARVLYNFPEFGRYSVQVLLDKAKFHDEALTVSVGREDVEGDQEGAIFVRPSLRAPEFRSYHCEEKQSGPWAQTIARHDLALLPEPAPAAVCDLIYPGLQSNAKGQGCTISIVTPTQGLTAGHCDVVMAHYRDVRMECPGGVTRKIESRTPNPYYDILEARSPYDIAVFGWSEPVTGIAPLPIAEELDPSKDLLASRPETCRHYGYGNRSGGGVGEIGVAASAPLREFSGGAAYARVLLAEGLFATDPEAFMRSGDSGGPVVCRGADGVARIQAVHSFVNEGDGVAASVLVAQPGNARWLRQVLKR